MAVASPVAEYGLQGAQASVAAPRACGIFPNLELNSCPLHQQWILTYWATREVSLKTPLLLHLMEALLNFPASVLMGLCSLWSQTPGLKESRTQAECKGFST